MEETKLTAALPNLDIQIIHREDPERGAETIALQITATPSFDAVRGMLAPALMNPMLLNPMVRAAADPLKGMPFLSNPMMVPMFGAARNPAANPMVALWTAPMRAWADLMRQAWAPWLGASGGAQPGGPER